MARNMILGKNHLDNESISLINMQIISLFVLIVSFSSYYFQIFYK